MGERFTGTVAVEDETGTTNKKIVLNGNDGTLKIYNEHGKRTVDLYSGGNLVLGGENQEGRVSLYNSSGAQTIYIDGEAGDVILKNADAAEDFFVHNAVNVTPGTVLVIDDCNRLRPSSSAYDRRVAGVVSGGSTYKPGIVLDRQENMENRLPVALAGKVYVNADASDHPIAVGDLLTTSAYPGLAMCAVDSGRAFGAVIGKALAPLATGQGSVPILVSLQ